MRNPKLAAEIAKQLRKFHQVEIPGSKEPQLWNDVLKFFRKGMSFFTEHSFTNIYSETSFFLVVSIIGKLVSD